MNKMRIIAVDDPLANMAERIEVLRVVGTFGDPRNIVLDANPDLPHGFDANFT